MGTPNCSGRSFGSTACHATSSLCVDYEFRAALLFRGSESIFRVRPDPRLNLILTSNNSDVKK
jgi:hypothetical protein